MKAHPKLLLMAFGFYCSAVCACHVMCIGVNSRAVLVMNANIQAQYDPSFVEGMRNNRAVLSGSGMLLLPTAAGTNSHRTSPLCGMSIAASHE